MRFNLPRIPQVKRTGSIFLVFFKAGSLCRACIVYKTAWDLSMSVLVQPTITIDCDFHFPRYAASYLIFDEGEAAFIENNTSRCVPKLVATLGEYGLTVDDVKYVIITHVHLDHAGGTSELMKACPRAQLIAHPKAGRHMIDPSRLVAGARAVYGDKVFDEVYGTINGVDAARVRTMEDYETLELGGRTLQFVHARGHANHHFCILDQSTGDIFTGDAFGQAYPDIQGNGLFIFPSSSPTEFNGNLAIEAIDKMMALKPKRACLTHFGAIDNLAAAAEIMKSDLRDYENILAQARLLRDEQKIGEFCKTEIREHFARKLKQHSLSWTKEIEDLLAIDIQLNADGIAYQAILRNSQAV